MDVGIIGLGRMGMNMALRLLSGKHRIVAYNRSPEKVRSIARKGAAGAFSAEQLVALLKAPRVIWLMLPAGSPTDAMIDQLVPLLARGDILVDGGNAFYKDDIRRAESLSKAGIGYLDAGVSGGIWGLKNGYCLMIGGPQPLYRKILPLIKTLSPKNGSLYCGPTGAGHFLKMIHNGIEYGMMAAIGEGFALLDASPYSESLDYAAVSRLWNQGSVVRSWLMEMAERAFTNDPRLSGISGHIDDSGEGRWTVQQAIETAVPAPVIAAALFQRFASRRDDDFSDRLTAALRREFGGHAVKPSKERRNRG
ncbi:MAG TPA: decarboxylating 6-phosphogluconate dehydrogenase [Dissulfurispiraceae bacterium]|nr:decarboxylating 6-phosphogluconate dehydrogenase [Dissulfurispiraceae bacterium]